MGSCAAPSAKGDDKFITTDYLQQCRQIYPLIWLHRPVLLSVKTIQVVNSLGGDEHLLSSAKLAFSASHSLVLGTASVLLILLAVVVWFTLPERKIRQLGKQRATPH
ncbi:hypothetical protein [Escherichia coli]|uniref:hypothetical protein n=1 Tax=Escherichia coli TaxID=562 RepID=UPI00203512A3|nr:hypothetical protein [Escherichia coli]